jgi:hypothetical protein
MNACTRCLQQSLGRVLLHLRFRYAASTLVQMSREDIPKL